jgi:hypothetical protein
MQDFRRIGAVLRNLGCLDLSEVDTNRLVIFCLS